LSIKKAQNKDEDTVETNEDKPEGESRVVKNLKGKILKKALLLVVFIALFLISFVIKDLEFYGTSRQDSNSSNATV
jgi:hypothetical protein